MEITVRRFAYGQDSTLSVLLVDDVFAAYVVEDEGRTRKKWGETRIPTGRYRAGFRRTEAAPGQPKTFHQRYAAVFPEIHRGMIELLDVPNFSAILLHCGNTDDDTAGCLIVGSRAHMIMTAAGAEFEVRSSRAVYRRLYPRIAAELEADRPVWFTIENFTHHA